VVNIFKELKQSVIRAYKDIKEGKLIDLFFKIQEYMEIGNRTPTKFHFLLSQISTITIILSLTLGIDISRFRFQLIFLVLFYVFGLICLGYVYRRFGIQKKEDFTNMKMNYVGSTLFKRIEETHKVVMEMKEYDFKKKKKKKKKQFKGKEVIHKGKHGTGHSI